jgi:hypothetical protein
MLTADPQKREYRLGDGEHDRNSAGRLPQGRHCGARRGSGEVAAKIQAHVIATNSYRAVPVL